MIVLIGLVSFNRLTVRERRRIRGEVKALTADYPMPREALANPVCGVLGGGTWQDEAGANGMNKGRHRATVADVGRCKAGMATCPPCRRRCGGCEPAHRIGVTPASGRDCHR